MSNMRTLAIGALGLVLSTHSLQGQERSRYRDFQLGGDLPSISAFRIIMTSPRLDALARTADAQAARWDEREAPLREIARQKKDAEDARTSQETARVTNRAGFRP